MCRIKKCPPCPRTGVNHVPGPNTDDLLGMARIWRQTFQPQGRLRDFTCAWQACVSPVNQIAC
ncbi:hypothetical protein C1886_22980 [Pseudomonas sp. FW300-N1A1]|nr:hypothetical protein C1886_22980 [Pseudomonas sp. FW300-N1A1]